MEQATGQRAWQGREEGSNGLVDNRSCLFVSLSWCGVCGLFLVGKGILADDKRIVGDVKLLSRSACWLRPADYREKRMSDEGSLCAGVGFMGGSGQKSERD